METKCHCCVLSAVVLFSLCLLPTQCLRSEISVIRIFTQSDARQAGRTDVGGCGCSRFECGCCAHLQLEKIYLNDTVCVNVTYLPDQYGVSLTFSVDGTIYFNRTVSLRNPPPICIAVPYLKQLASLCVQLHDLHLHNHTLTGCVRVLARLEGLIVDTFEIGCFRIPPWISRTVSTDSNTQADFKHMMAYFKGSRGGFKQLRAHLKHTREDLKHSTLIQGQISKTEQEISNN